MNLILVFLFIFLMFILWRDARRGASADALRLCMIPYFPTMTIASRAISSSSDRSWVVLRAGCDPEEFTSWTEEGLKDRLLKPNGTRICDDRMWTSPSEKRGSGSVCTAVVVVESEVFGNSKASQWKWVENGHSPLTRLGPFIRRMWTFVIVDLHERPFSPEFRLVLPLNVLRKAGVHSFSEPWVKISSTV